MYRIDNSTAATTLPTPAGVGPNPNGYFTVGNPAGGVAATIVDQDWANAIQEELANAVTASGQALSKTTRTQLATSIADQIATETSRAEAAEALRAPIANPAFTGNGSITGNWTVDGAATIDGASTLSSTLHVTGASVFSSTVSVSGELSSGGEINNPWGYIASSGIYSTANLNAAGGGGVGTSWSVGNTLVVGAGMSTFEGGATVYGTLTLYNNTTGVSGGWEAQVPSGGSSAALESNIGIVGGGTTYTVGAGYYMTPEGVASNSGTTSTFGLITGYYAQAQVYWASSDIRLKEDFSPITPEEGRQFVLNVHPTSYKWKQGGGVGTGYVAQQLIAAGYPNLVQAFPQDNLPAETHEIDGVSITSEENIRLTAKYDDMIAYLHAALRYALSEIDALKAQR